MEVEQRASAARASYVVRLENTNTSSLKGIVSDSQGLSGSFLALDQNCISYPIAEEGSDICGGIEQGG